MTHKRRGGYIVDIWCLWNVWVHIFVHDNVGEI